jgi:hypothetical protein
LTYNKTTWTDRNVQYPGRYSKTSESANVVTLLENPGNIIQAGTPVNAANMNNIENGINDAHESLRAAEREIASLKMASTLRDKVDGASDYFYDDFAGVYAPRGSAAEVDRTWNSAKAAISSGQTVIPLYHVFTNRFLVGQEVTIQSAATESTRERRVITAVDPVNNTITVSPATSNSYSIGALIYRSWATRATNALKFARSQKCLPIDTSGTGVGATKITGQNITNPSAASYDAEYMVEYLNSSGWDFFRRFGDKFEKLFRVPYNIMTTVGTPTNGVWYKGFVLSPDGTYLYILHGTANDSYSQYITIVKRISDFDYQYITRMDFSVTSGIYSNSIAFSPKGTYLAMCYNGFQLRVYKLSGDIPTTVCTVNVQPSSGPFIGINWSYDEQWITFTYWSSGSASSNGTWVQVYRQSGDVFTQQPANTLPFTGTSLFIGTKAFSKDSQYFCMLAGTAGQNLTLYVYKITGTTWTQTKTLNNSSTLYSQFCLTPDSLYIYTSASFNTSFYRYNLTDASGSTSQTAVTYNGGGVATSAYFTFGVDPKGDFISNTLDGYAMNMTPMDLLQVDVRYNLKNQSKAIRGMVAFVKRLSAITGTITGLLSATATTTESYTTMAKVTETVDSATALDTLSVVLPNGTSQPNATLKLNVVRTSTSQDTTITELTGAIE